jgi:hypothetical protein
MAPLDEAPQTSRFAHDIPASPPAHVLAEVDAAWERAQTLIGGELELHFAQGLTGRVRAELRVPGGEAVQPLTAGEALALACGDAMLAVAA